jgi:hypothetical protein
MRRLLRRGPPNPDRLQETSALPEADGEAEETWQERLATVGRAIDAARYDLREVVVTTAGPLVLVSALAWSSGLYGGRWFPVTLLVGERTVRPLGVDVALQVTDVGGWTRRLTAVAKQLDRVPGALSDVCVLEVEGGFVVEALVRDLARQAWVLTSLEVVGSGEGAG